MTAENAELKMTYLDLQAYAGVTKHMGGFEATDELLSLCHIKNAQQVLDVGCGIGVGPAYMAKTYGCRVVGVDILDRRFIKETLSLPKNLLDKNQKELLKRLKKGR